MQRGGTGMVRFVIEIKCLKCFDFCIIFVKRFSSGPISQNDTIELRGFDEPEKGTNKRAQRSKRFKDWKKKQTDTQPLTEEDDCSVDRNSPTPQAGDDDGMQQQQSESQQQGKNVDGSGESNERSSGGEQAFNFDEILKCDSIPGLLSVSKNWYNGIFCTYFNSRQC